MVVTPHRGVSRRARATPGTARPPSWRRPGMPGTVSPDPRAPRGAAAAASVIENISRGRDPARAAAAAVAAAATAPAPPREDAEDASGDRERRPKGVAPGPTRRARSAGVRRVVQRDAVHEIERRGVPEFFAEGVGDDAESRYRAPATRRWRGSRKSVVFAADAATRRAMAAAAPGANGRGHVRDAAARVRLLSQMGPINWTAVDQTGGPGADPPGARRDETKSEKPAGTNAAVDALFRSTPRPPTAPPLSPPPSRRRASWRRAAGIREVMAPRAGRPPKNRDPPPMRRRTGSSRRRSSGRRASRRRAASDSRVAPAPRLRGVAGRHRPRVLPRGDGGRRARGFQLPAPGTALILNRNST